MGASLSAVSAEPMVLQHNGKAYSCSHLTLEKKAKFENWVKAQAMAALRQMRESGVFSEEEYAAEKRQMLVDMSTGKYGFYGPLVMAATSTEAGAVVLSSILFGVTEDEMLQLMAAKPEEVKTLMDLMIVESQPKNMPAPSEAMTPATGNPVAAN